jgi:hypothetical protein
LWRVGRVFDEEGIGCAMHCSWLSNSSFKIMF